MKKIVATLTCLLLAIIMCVGLVACETGEIKVNPDKEHYVVGICQLTQHAALDEATRGFKEALQTALAEKGRTVEFDEQNASNEPTICTTIVSGFVAKDIDLILANATSPLQAAAAATATIPVLGTSITDYATALEIDNWTGTVGNNISGTSDLALLTNKRT